MKNTKYKNWALSVVSSFCLLSSSIFAGDKVNELIETKNNGTITIDVPSGSVKITTWQKAEIKVVGELSDEAEGYQFTVDEDGDAYFNVQMQNNRWGNWGKDDDSKLEFYIPELNNLRFEGVNVDVVATGIKGGTRVNTVNGDIKAKNLSTRIKLGTVNGSIQAENLNGSINLNTVNGEIEDKNSQGELEIETVNGEVETQTTATEIGISTVNGEINIQAGEVDEIEIGTVNGAVDSTLTLREKGRLTASSVGGRVELNLVGPISANFNLESHVGGSITNRLTNDKPKEAKYGPSKSLRFQMGTGSAEVQIDTVSGSIRLNKK